MVEDVLSKFQGENETFHTLDDNDSEEGAKIMKMLEKAAEPEVIMAEMTSEQLTSFASYQAKLEVHFQELISFASYQANFEQCLDVWLVIP